MPAPYSISLLDSRFGVALLLAQTSSATQINPQEPGAIQETSPKLVSIGQIDLTSVNPSAVTLEAKNIDDLASRVEMDREGRVLVEEGFSGSITICVGTYRGVVTIKTARATVPEEIVLSVRPWQEEAVAALAYAGAPPMICRFPDSTPSRPSSKRGARAASGDKPWQVRSWRGAGARPGRR